MEEVVHPDQTYCVPGRIITDNIILLRDLLDISKLIGLNAGIMPLDQCAAFDQVEHQYFWKTVLLSVSSRIL